MSERASHQLSPERIASGALEDGRELTPVREQPIIGEAQQLVIDGFFKALEERKG